MAVKFSNNFKTTITGDITSSSTSVTLNSMSGFPDANFSEDHVFLTIENSSRTKLEIVKVTDTSGSTCTIERGQEGTTAQDFDSGSEISNRLTAGVLNSQIDHPNKTQTHGAPSGERLVHTGDSWLTDSREWSADTVSQSEAENGTSTTRRAWTAQRVKQAIMKIVNALTKDDVGLGNVRNEDIASYGLGTVTSAVSNLDDLFTPGLYNVTSSATGQPASGNSGTCLVIAGGAGGYTQTWVMGNTLDSEKIFTRHYRGESNGWSTWVEHWHDGNDGDGSGLDADKLDGNESSYFYSPSNPPPASTPSTSYGAVGTYLFAYHKSSIYITRGDTTSGSNLVPAGLGGHDNHEDLYSTGVRWDDGYPIYFGPGTDTPTPAGTWRAMGQTQSHSDYYNQRQVTLWVRIS